MNYIEILPPLLRKMGCPEELIPEIVDEHPLAWIKLTKFLQAFVGKETNEDRSA